MNEWSIRRKRIILTIVITFLVVVVALPLFFILYHAPTCSDSRKNGDETGIDCGGSCQRLCTSDSLPIIGKGDPRLLRVSTSAYAVVAYEENPNVQGEILRAGYTFKIYDKTSSAPIMLVGKQAFVPKNSSFVIFEGPFTFSSSTPVRVTFEWDASTLVYEKNIKLVPDLTIKDKILTDEQGEPHLNATLLNSSLEAVSNIELVALLEDANGNIIAASKTFVDSLNPGESEPVVWSWPAPVGRITTTEVIPRIFPDKSFIR